MNGSEPAAAFIELRTEFRLFSERIVEDLTKMSSTLELLVEQNARIAVISQRIDGYEKDQQELFRLVRAHEKAHADENRDALRDGKKRLRDLIMEVVKWAVLLTLGAFIGGRF